MNPYSFNYGHDDFWADLAARVKPFLGDVELTLGYQWMDLIEAQFSRADFVAVSMAARYQGVQPRWYVVQWYEGSGGLYDNGEVLKSGESRESCLAYLLERCTDYGMWPDSVVFDDVADRTTFSLGGTLFAAVYFVGSDRSFDLATVRRVEGTLVGLRKTDVTSEFAKRFSHWPGLASVNSRDNRSSGKSSKRRVPPSTHFPCPSEWLISAESLLTTAGETSPTMQNKQQLAAAVFGAVSWNHLCGLVPAQRAKSDWWSLYAPTYVVGGVSLGDHPRVYHGVVAAFLDFRAHAAEALAAGDVEATFDDDVPAYPEILVRADTDLLISSPIVYMGAVTAVDPGAEWESRVRFATRSQYIEGLQRLFMDGESLDVKLASRAALRGLELLAVDGPWRFYVEDRGTVSRDLLIAELYEASGKKAGSVAVPIYKGDLCRFEGVDGLVLVADYDGSMPGAILKGLSTETVRAIVQTLQYRGEADDEDDGISEFVGWREHEAVASAIDRLLQRMTQAGATYYS